MTPETLELIKEYAAIASAVLPFIITALIALSKSVKSAKVTKGLQNAAKVAQAVESFVISAEQFQNFKGTEKKEWVLGKLAAFAYKNHIEFNEAVAADLIENIVAITKKVNAREKDLSNAEEVLQ